MHSDFASENSLSSILAFIKPSLARIRYSLDVILARAFKSLLACDRLSFLVGCFDRNQIFTQSLTHTEMTELQRKHFPWLPTFKVLVCLFVCATGRTTLMEPPASMLGKSRYVVAIREPSARYADTKHRRGSTGGH